VGGHIVDALRRQTLFCQRRAHGTISTRVVDQLHLSAGELWSRRQKIEVLELHLPHARTEPRRIRVHQLWCLTHRFHSARDGAVGITNLNCLGSQRN